jgi:cell division protein FtsN
MRKTTVLILLLSIFVMSCRSARKMTPVPQPSPPAARSVPAEPPKPAEPEKAEEIPVIEESFKFQRMEDEASHEVNRFFVILGSFRVPDNADRFKTRLAGEGFDPVILLSETGLNRISVNSYSREADARQRVLHIRRTYPQYHDAWLLIRR